MFDVYKSREISVFRLISQKTGLIEDRLIFQENEKISVFTMTNHDDDFKEMGNASEDNYGLGEFYSTEEISLKKMFSGKVLGGGRILVRHHAGPDGFMIYAFWLFYEKDGGPEGLFFYTDGGNVEVWEESRIWDLLLKDHRLHEEVRIYNF